MNKRKFIRPKRVITITAIFCAAMLLALGRLAFLMIFYADTNLAKASNQWVRTTSVSAQRGQITDCMGNLLAGSAGCDKIVLFPQTLYADDEKYGSVDFVIQTLAEVLGEDPDKVRIRIEANKERVEYTFERQITQEQSDRLNEIMEQCSQETLEDKTANPLYRKMRAVKLVSDTRRYYPNGAFMTQVIGFTDVDGHGLTGIENNYDAYLTGQDGSVTYAKDGSGNELTGSGDVEDYTAPINGYTVQLTLDGVVQSFAEREAENCLNEQNANAVRCIVMDPKEADILAMANLPDYDNNDPHNMDENTLNRLSRNGCISETYEIGGFLDLFLTACEIDSGRWNLSDPLNCQGTIETENRTLYCQGCYSHGTLSIREALLYGCTAGFANRITEIGVDRVYDAICTFDPDEKTNVGLIAEAAGSVRSSKYMGEAEVASLGMGHGVTMTPLRLLTSVCTLINGGNQMQPYAVRSVTDGNGLQLKEYSAVTVKENVVSSETVETIRQLFRDSADHGCGCSGSFADCDIGAYSVSVPQQDEDGNETGAYTSIYIAAAPMDDPEVAVLFLVDHPENGLGTSASAPYAEAVLEEAIRYLGIYEGKDESYHVAVPSVEGQTAELAANTLKNSGFTVTIQGGHGDVKCQYPAAGTEVPRGSCITLECGAGFPDGDWVEVPDVTGMKAQDARELLEGLNLRMAIRGNGSTSTGQWPEATTRVRKGAIVTVEFPTVLDPAPTATPRP